MGRTATATARRLGDDVADRVADGELPDDLRGEVDAETFFGDEDPEVFFARKSGPVTLVVFEGEHDLVYHPGLAWMMSRP